ncbi:MAG: hypothetical protein Kow00108_03940 [Calditrichia bacterium]
MNKAEKIQRIKTLQSEISEHVKSKQFSIALEKMDELLTLAPNLEKIKKLREKIEKLVPSESPKEHRPEPSPEKVSEETTEVETAESVESPSEPPGEEKEADVKTITEEDEIDSKNVETSEEKDETVTPVEEIESLVKEEMGLDEDKDLSLDELMSEQEKSREILEDETIPDMEEDQAPAEVLDELIESDTDSKKESSMDKPLSELSDEAELESLLDDVSDQQEQPISYTEDVADESEDIKPDIDFGKIMDAAIEEDSETEENLLEGIEISEPAGFSLDEDKKEKTESVTELKSEDLSSESEEDRPLTKEDLDNRLKELLSSPKKEEETKTTSGGKYEIDYSAGIPTIDGGKRKEKLDYEFKLSSEPGISAQPQVSPAPTGETYSPTVDARFAQEAKSGFRLGLIPQALGFALNLERMMFLTIGILLSMAVSKLLTLLLPAQIAVPATVLISSAINMFFLTFIAYTILLQMNHHIHNNFREHFGVFIKKAGVTALVYWFIYVVALIALGISFALIMSLMKLGELGTTLYAVLSLPSFILIVMFVLMLLASPLLSFIVPGLIVIDNPTIMGSFVESVRLLKNHLFSVLGGFLYTLLLNIFLAIMLYGIFIVSVIILFGVGMLIGGPQFMTLLSGLPPMLTGGIGLLLSKFGLMPMMMGAGASSSIAGSIFMIMLFIGLFFLITIPMIFSTGGGVITYLSLKGKKDIHKGNVD